MRAGDEQPLSNITVTDGDTIFADCDGKRIEIRLRGIDAPESDQPFGEESEDYLTYLLSSRQARTVTLKVVEPSDRYGRVIGFLHRYDARGHWHNVNVEMVRAGMAYCYREYGGGTLEFETAEYSAKVDREGVWEAGRHGHEKPWDKRNADPVSRVGNWLGRCFGNLLDGDEEE